MTFAWTGVVVLLEGEGAKVGPEAGDGLVAGDGVPDGLVAGDGDPDGLVAGDGDQDGLVAGPDVLGLPLGVDELLGGEVVELGLELVVEVLWDSNCCS